MDYNLSLVSKTHIMNCFCFFHNTYIVFLGSIYFTYVIGGSMRLKESCESILFLFIKKKMGKSTKMNTENYNTVPRGLQRNDSRKYNVPVFF